VREKAGLLPNMSWTTGLKEGGETKEHAANRHQSFNGLLEHISKRSPYWEKMQLREGARARVVSGERDDVVKSYKSADFFKNLPQFDFVSVPNGHHATACVDPAQVIAAAS
jgi:pimeloyl-ACP methyl ester carboxylesterase